MIEALKPLLADRCVVAMYLNFGPYHVARLRAIAAALEPYGARLVGIELAAVEKGYPWRVARRQEPFEWCTLFHDREVERIPGRELDAAVRAALEACTPCAVAIPGWSHAFVRGAAAWCRRRSPITVLWADSTAGSRELGAKLVKRRWYIELYKRWLLRGFHAAQVAGDASAEYIASLGIPRSRITLKCDVVDNDYFAKLADETRADAAMHRRKYGVPEKFFFLPARLMHRKNQLGLLDAYSIYLRKAGSAAWSLVLVGSGETEREVDAKVAAMNTPLVIRRPFLQSEDVARLNGLASALVFTSLMETWGLILNESAAAGLPLLISDRCPAVDHLLIDGENGYVLDPNDHEQVADRMYRVSSLSEGALAAMGAASRRIVADWGCPQHAEELLRAIAVGAASRDGR